MSCMYCGAHMNLITQRHRTNTYVCPECGTEYDHAWTLPIFEPGTDRLTQNGEYLVRLHSILHHKTKGEVYETYRKRRQQSSIA